MTRSRRADLALVEAGLFESRARAQEAIAGSARIAAERGNPVVEPDHLLAALLEAREGIVEPVLARAGADVPGLRAAVDAAMDKRPQVSGSATGAQLSTPFHTRTHT